MYFIVQGLSGGRPGCANPNLSSWWIEGDLKVFKRVTSKCLTSMYAFTLSFLVLYTNSIGVKLEEETLVPRVRLRVDSRNRQLAGSSYL